MTKRILIILTAVSLLGLSFWLGQFFHSQKASNDVVSLLFEDYCQKVEVEASQLPGRREQLVSKIDELRSGKLNCKSVAYGGVRDRLYLISSHVYGIEMLSRALQTATEGSDFKPPPFEMVAAKIDADLVSVLEQKCRYGSNEIERWSVLVEKNVMRVEKALTSASQVCLQNGYLPFKQRQKARASGRQEGQ